MKFKEQLKVWLFLVLPIFAICVVLALFLGFVVAPISLGAVLVIGIVFAFVFTSIVDKWIDFLIDKGVFK